MVGRWFDRYVRTEMRARAGLLQGLTGQGVALLGMALLDFVGRNSFFLFPSD